MLKHTPSPPPPPHTHTHPVVYSTDRSKAVVPVLFYDLPYVILFLCFSVLLALRLPRLGKRKLVLMFFVRLYDLRLFGFVCFLFLLVSGKAAVCDCGTPWTFLLPLFIDVRRLLEFSLFKTSFEYYLIFHTLCHMLFDGSRTIYI